MNNHHTASDMQAKEGSGEPAQSHSLVRAFVVRSHTLRKRTYIILPPQTPLLYNETGFNGVNIIFLISLKCRLLSIEFPQSMFRAKITNNHINLIIFSIFGEKKYNLFK